ncbi:MAG: PQQ-binding-like beta-propeller repeat protein, partial [Phycisphaerae bacterium]|nr:PQQ-binding-like beta-propeller repeat protein [Phycisphaerae bacterium]
PLPATFVAGELKKGTELIDLSTTKNVKWVAKMGSSTYGNPTIAGGRVFVGTNNDGRNDPRFKGDYSLLKCLDAATGKTNWTLTVPKLGAGKVSDWEYLGICSSAAIDGKRAYIVTSRCEIVCVDVEGLANGNQGVQDEGKYMTGGKGAVELRSDDADILWRYDMRDDLGVFPHNVTSSSPLVVGKYVYAATSNGKDWSHTNTPNPKAPSLIVLDKVTGELVGEEDSGISRRVLHANWSSPAYGEVNGKGMIVFAAGDGYCYGFDPKPVKDEDGFGILKELWRFDSNPIHYRYRREADSSAFKTSSGRLVPITYVKADGLSEHIASPVVYKNRVYISIGQDPEHGEGAGCISAIDATKRGDLSPHLVDAAKTKVSANPKAGAAWRNTKINRTISTASLADDLVYVADYSGFVYCLDANTGKELWKHDTLSHIWGSTLVADGKVYIGNEDGDVTILKAGREKKVLATVPVDDPVYSSPVAANGVLYIASQTQLYAISVSDK